MLDIDNIIQIFSEHNVKLEFDNFENFIASLEKLVHYYDTMQRFIYYDYIYTEEEISYLNDICKTTQWTRISDGTLNNPENINPNGNRYASGVEKYLDPDKLIQEYFNYIPEKTADSLQIGFTISNGYTPDVKLTKYDAGDDYGWHCDCWIERPGVNWKRQISSITYLNDDYEGGQTEFECGAIIEPKAGKTLIFPSNWCFSHRGRPVTKGTKYLYVKHIWM